MKKTRILLLFISFVTCLAAQDVITNDSVKVDKLNLLVRDTLSADSVGDLNDLLNDMDLQPMDYPHSSSDVVIDSEVKTDTLSEDVKPFIRLDMVMPDPEQVDTLVADSAKIDSLMQSGVSADSLQLKELLADTISMDQLVLDSTVIDTLKFDSAYFYKQQELVRDSLRKDSIRLKKMADEKRRQMILPSIREFNQMLATYRTQFNELFDLWDDYYITKDYVRMRPEYYKFVVPMTYYSSSIREAGSIDGWEPEDPYTKQRKTREQKMNEQLPDMRISKPIYDEVEKRMLALYVNYPGLVERNEEEFSNISLLSDKDMEAGPRNENVLTMIQPINQVEKVTESDLTVFRPNFWTKGGSGYLQFSQNHISDNWYKGGESTKSLLSGLVLFANFNDKHRIQFENKLEWKLGFITAPSDTLHSYKANNDLFRLTSKFGLKAIKSWYYTLSVDFKTQFFSNYQTNTDNLISAFFSPAELNVGLGMDFKYAKDGVCNLSVLMNPVNYTLYTVLSDEVDPTKFNIEKGHKHQSVYGSRFEANLKWKVFKPLIWESRLSYTTNYEKALAEWENTFTFVVNKYLSTKLFVHARFDDGVKRKENGSYFQLQEILSFGLNYTW